MANASVLAGIAVLFAGLTLCGCNPVGGPGPVRLGGAFVEAEQAKLGALDVGPLDLMAPTLQAKAHRRDGKLVYGPDFTLNIPLIYLVGESDGCVARFRRVTLSRTADHRVVFSGRADAMAVNMISPDWAMPMGGLFATLPEGDGAGLRLDPVGYELEVDMEMVDHGLRCPAGFSRRWRFTPAPRSVDGLSGGYGPAPGAPAGSVGASVQAFHASVAATILGDRSAGPPRFALVWDGHTPAPGLTLAETRRLLTLQVKARGTFHPSLDDLLPAPWQAQRAPHLDSPAAQVARLGLEGPDYARLMNRTMRAAYQIQADAFARHGPVTIRGVTPQGWDEMAARYPDTPWEVVDGSSRQIGGDPASDIRLTPPQPILREDLYPEGTG